jgi:hypothetical protein
MNPRLKPVGLQMDTAMLLGIANYLRVWLHDKQPSQNIQTSEANCPSSVFIRMFGVAALLADEKLSSLPVRPFSVAALIALLAGVLRINKDPEHTASFRLVSDESPELVKAPRVHAVTLIFLSPYPVANAIEVFECNPASGAFSQRYHRFGNYMIRVSREPLLFLAALLQEPFSAFSALLLQLASQRMIAMSHLVDVGAGMPVTIRIKSNISDPEIHSKQIGWQLRFSFLDLNADVQIEAAVAIDQIALAARQRKKLTLFVTADERERKSPSHRPDRDGGFVQVPREQTQIVDGRACRVERSRALADRIGVRNLGASANGCLSGKAKEQSDAFVACGLQLESRINTKLSGPLRKPIARRTKRFHRIEKAFGLLGRRLQLNLGDQFHAYSTILTLDPFL